MQFMPIHELRNPDEARRYLLQSLWLQCVQAPRAATMPATLEWAIELVGGGEPLPPLGFVADVGHAVFPERDEMAGMKDEKEPLHIPGWPEGLARTYEDYVLGKLYADSSFERAGDALRHYRGRDRARGLAFLIAQFRQRAGFGGILLSPAIVKTMRDRAPEEVLSEGWDSFETAGPLPLLATLYEELVAQVRQTAGVLAAEDVFELEHRTALAHFSQRLALRQVLQASAALQAGLPDKGLRPRVRRHEVPTRILDEDVYPVGGFSSLCNRGSIESLLHSQLAYMETERPDLFDIKYLRDELLYYARDENQFLRRRRTFVFALHADLGRARFKDAELPWQRIVLLLGLMLAAMRKLMDWLGEDSLLFEFVFIDADNVLAAEKSLLEMVLREQIANGAAIIANLSAGQVITHCGRQAQRSLCHLLSAATGHSNMHIDQVRPATLALAGTRPELTIAGDNSPMPDAEDAIASWAATLERLLEHWL